MKSIEELIFDKKFPGEKFEPNDFNDWAKENSDEAYELCKQQARELLSIIYDEIYKDIIGDPLNRLKTPNH